MSVKDIFNNTVTTCMYAAPIPEDEGDYTFPQKERFTPWSPETVDQVRTPIKSIEKVMIEELQKEIVSLKEQIKKLTERVDQFESIVAFDINALKYRITDLTRRIK